MKITREEKCILAIEMGYTYNQETGKVYGVRGKEITKYNTTGYITINNSKFSLLAHQFAWFIIYGEIVVSLDHINGIRDDNRIINLRSVTHQSNCWNNTKAKGYSWNKRDKRFVASLKINGKSIILGRYKTEEEARIAYLKGKEIYHNIENPNLSFNEVKKS